MNATSIVKVSDINVIKGIMKLCDHAYTESVVALPDFEDLCRKICDVGVFFAMKLESDVIGYIAFYANDVVSKEAYISLLCIRPEYQGLGFGKALINRCFEESLDCGMKSIRLAVLKRDVYQQKFYIRQGFSINNESDDRYYLSKAL
ncbi:Acetyltransferase (GNAT) domain-containing protein [Oscillospiraceae bacterium]|nr:Acetyltransferase (GNAT) domain-containing protein [Oscillospiraceae bacterium]